MLRDTVFDLIQNKFSDYLNLLYIIDVSEEKIKGLSGTDTHELSEQVTFLILKREWQKVWYRNKL
jgi:L-lysine 2,3-aminomutase